MVRCFSASGSAKNACAVSRSASSEAASTPCPVMVKKPISRQVRSISAATSRRPAGPPSRAAVRSMTGMPGLMLSSVIIGAAVDDERLAGDEGGVGSGEEGDGADEILRDHVARQRPAAQRALLGAGDEARIALDP